MKCVIQCVCPLRNKLSVITLRDDKILIDDGRYERVVLEDEREIEKIYSKLYEVIFSWKQEYIGDRVYDGEKYLIELDVNHKRKKYKIQNKFPDNWADFVLIREKILAFNEE